MRTRTALLTAAVMLALAAGAEAGTLSGLTRVRPLNAQATSLLADAQEKSVTIRDLIKKLESGDVVAYVHVVPAAEGTPQSGLRFVGASRTVRYVLIQVVDCRTPYRGIELLGHELQHVTEVMPAAWVTDDNNLQRLLSLTGYPDSSSARRYETMAAASVERKVHRDVRAAIGSVQ